MSKCLLGKCDMDYVICCFDCEAFEGCAGSKCDRDGDEGCEDRECRNETESGQ